MRYSILFLSIPILLLCGCMFTNPIQYGDYNERTTIDFPELSIVTERSIGETLAAKGIRIEAEAIKVSAPTVFNKKKGDTSVVPCGMTVSPIIAFKRGIYLSPKEGNADCYGPVNHMSTLADGSTHWNCPGSMYASMGDICLKQNGEYFLVGAFSLIFPLKQDDKHLSKITKAVEDQSNFIQELVYSGRADNHLKFIYRELTSDNTNPSFFQEVQYDLSESNIVEFKGLKIEVVEASNTKIRYRLLSHFYRDYSE